MCVYCRMYSWRKLLVITAMCGVFLCLSFISVPDNWAPQQNNSRKQFLKMNDLMFDQNDSLVQNPKDDKEHQYREREYESRLQLVRDICGQNDIVVSSKVATNRHSGNVSHCLPSVCPIIVLEKNVMFCFTPKVASTHIKRFFLNISGIHLSDELRIDDNAMHFAANDLLTRVSSVYYSHERLNNFYKVMFVRHPFDRLVSAFRDKAEAPRSEKGYFYSNYWDPIMKELRPKGSQMDRITFREFVWYLTHTSERKYDDHWAPVWSRCDPCSVDYNFIGKLETGQQDFLYAFRQAGVEFNPNWWNDYPSSTHSVSLEYFAPISEDAIRKLYEIYRLDFELFGYSIKEFLLNRNIMES